MSEQAQPGVSPRRKGPLRESIETVAVALLVAFLLRGFVAEVYRVDGRSMLNTLHDRERVLVSKLTYRLRTPQPGEIIVFRSPSQPDRDFIKRVVAVAGDRVELRQGRVLVNGQPITEAPDVMPTTQTAAEQVVPPHAVWVLGDNRNHSEDSRAFGQVPLENIRGVAVARIWPLKSFTWFANPVKAADQAKGR